MKFGLKLSVLVAAMLSSCVYSTKVPQKQQDELRKLGAYSIGQTFHVKSPIWVRRIGTNELTHGLGGASPEQVGSIAKFNYPAYTPGDIVVRIEKVRLHYTALTGYEVKPTAVILNGELQGYRISMASDGSWSLREEDETNTVYYKPKPGKVTPILY